MQLAVHSFQFPLLSLEKVCQIVSALEISALDIGALKSYAHLDPDEIEAGPAKLAERVRRAVEPYGLQVSDFFPSFGAGFADRPLNHPDPAVQRLNLDRFRAFVEIAGRIGSPGITLLPGIRFEALGPGRSLDLAAAAFERLLPLARAAGLRLSFEAHLGGVFETPEEVLAFVERFPDLKVTLDYSHFIARGIPAGRVHPLLPWAGHFHFRQARPGCVQTGAAEGVLDPLDLAGRLLACGYAGYFTVEYTWQDWENCKNVDTLSETILVRDQLQPLLQSQSAPGLQRLKGEPQTST